MTKLYVRDQDHFMSMMTDITNNQRWDIFGEEFRDFLAEAMLSLGIVETDGTEVVSLGIRFELEDSDIKYLWGQIAVLGLSPEEIENHDNVDHIDGHREGDDNRLSGFTIQLMSIFIPKEDERNKEVVDEFEGLPTFLVEVEMV